MSKTAHSYGSEPSPDRLVKGKTDDVEVYYSSADATQGEGFDQRPESNRRISTFSAVALIVNRIVGTGIFATPASILGSVGSPGLALFLWVIGALIASAGALVYLEFATSLPRSGGEKNYLEFVYRRPAHLITAMYAAYAALLGWPAGNSVFAGQMFLNAGGIEADRWNSRAIGVGVLTFALLLNAVLPRYGLWLSNLFSVFKLVLLIFIIITGFVAAGQGRTDNLTNAFSGTSTTANAFVSALYNVIWSFIGYTNLFYSLSEVRQPIRTAKRAVPLALGTIIILYILINIAFFAAIPRERMIASDRLVAAEFFVVMFGESAGRAISVIVGLSAVGNSLVVLFAQGRVNQELGREGILPFSKFFALNKPFNTPFAGLALHWAVTLVIILAPPTGDAYSFLLNLVSYPLNIFNVLVSFGLIVIYFRKDYYGWNPPLKATLPVVVFFFLVNIFLVVAPLVPPAPGGEPYADLPYWLHVVVSFGLLAVGAVYWLVWAVGLPKVFGYTLTREVIIGDDGLTRNVFRKVKNE